MKIGVVLFFSFFIAQSFCAADRDQNDSLRSKFSLQLGAFRRRINRINTQMKEYSVGALAAATSKIEKLKIEISIIELSIGLQYLIEKPNKKDLRRLISWQLELEVAQGKRTEKEAISLINTFNCMGLFQFYNSVAELKKYYSNPDRCLVKNYCYFAQKAQVNPADLLLLAGRINQYFNEIYSETNSWLIP